ncbi:hypothetical protein [Flavobacterium chryseum]|uniref:hypothetical protein n=1 Tax=Flavobacterium sp. P3160 TaxID=2512113 RepID=UPI00105D18A2|nr:hypothetical protein [Flavobacterium sp. P3160]
MIYGTNFYKFSGRFEEIGLLQIVAVFDWLYEFGLDVLLGLMKKKYKNSIGLWHYTNIKFYKYYGGFEKIVMLKAELSFFGYSNFCQKNLGRNRSGTYVDKKIRCLSQEQLCLNHFVNWQHNFSIDISFCFYMSDATETLKNSSRMHCSLSYYECYTGTSVF